MFKSTDDGDVVHAALDPDQRARATGRLVFGTVLLVGAVLLVERAGSGVPLGAGKLIASTWCAAFLAAWIARLMSWTADVRTETVSVLSYVVPAFAMALLLPLTIHVPVALALGATPGELDEWVRLSLWITPTAHLAFAGLTALRAFQLAKGRTAISTRRIFTTTLIVSAIPFAFLLFIPPLLVGFTALAIVPLLDRMPRWIVREDAPTLPSAIVVA